jgi:hypothetical protein
MFKTAIALLLATSTFAQEITDAPAPVPTVSGNPYPEAATDAPATEAPATE